MSIKDHNWDTEDPDDDGRPACESEKVIQNDPFQKKFMQSVVEMNRREREETVKALKKEQG